MMCERRTEKTLTVERYMEKTLAEERYMESTGWTGSIWGTLG